MPTAEELLLQTHEHPVMDTDIHLVIDPDDRTITNPTRERITIMQYDHNSERLTFELPRYIEEHDMTLCNRVRIHFDNIDGQTGAENADVAEVYDLQVDADNEDIVTCSWVIPRQATQLAGELSFLIQYMCVSDDGVVTYEWHTDIFEGVDVKTGRNNGDPVVIEYSNILEQWYQKLFGGEIVGTVQTVGGVGPDENGDVPIEPTVISILEAVGLITLSRDENGVILTDENGAILLV